ncbi:VOC family protein [Radiobacillus sp. PE A8.2]|uniref:VOC family protein n=1 Tax=Radiobacillus sp. PE A8.2 TaxID=3380349 RepID=UPI00388E5180
MLNQVCVLTVKVNDLKNAIKFYTEVLDFKVSEHYGDKIISLMHDGIPIVLEETEKNALSPTNQHVLLGLYSEDIDRDFTLLQSRGAKLVFDEPQPCPPGRYFVIEDPSGNQIEIVEFSNM